MSATARLAAILGGLALAGAACLGAAGGMAWASPGGDQAELLATPPGPPVLPALGANAPAPTTPGLQSALDGPLTGPALGGQVSAVVLDPATGAVLYDRSASVPSVPASTTKLVTAVTVLSALGADARIATRVMHAPGSNELVLTGGGDPTLTVAPARDEALQPTASLTALAARTATALQRAGIGGSVRLGFDDSMFSGPRLSPDWSPEYAASGIIGPITALMADNGRIGGSVNPDPSAATAEKFKALLSARGVTVAGPVSRVDQPAAASELSRVESPPLTDIVEEMLKHSHNTSAEELAHLAGKVVVDSGSFAGGAQAAVSVLGDLGIDTAGLHLVDGSGLSRTDRISPLLLARVLASVTTNENDSIWAVGTGLPVAGFDGTLDERFGQAATAAALGAVRAKTGTLTGVANLAGTVVDRDGRLLTFAFLSNDVASIWTAEPALDRASAVLAACGCR